MRKRIETLLKDESGATAVEYGMILALVFLGFVASAQGLGNTTSELIIDTANTASNAMSGAV